MGHQSNAAGEDGDELTVSVEWFGEAYELDQRLGLTGAQPPAATVQIVENNLIVQRDPQQLGSFQVRVTVSDGVASTSQRFTVSIANEPVFPLTASHCPQPESSRAEGSAVCRER